jgi:hypothetical protein
VPLVGDLYKEYLAKSVSEAKLISLVESNELGFGLFGCFLSLSVYDGRYSVTWLFQRQTNKFKDLYFVV